MIGYTLEVYYGDTLGADEGIELYSSDVTVDGPKKGVPEVSFVGSTLGSTDGTSMGTIDSVSNGNNGGTIE